MKRVLVDVDGVLQNFVKFYCETARTVLKLDVVEGIEDQLRHPHAGIGLGLPRHHQKQMQALIDAPGVAQQLPVFPEMVRWVRRLIRRSDIEIFLVTRTPGAAPHWMQDRLNWAGATFRWKYPANHVIFAAQKNVIRGDMLIDDNVETVLAWAKENPEGKGVVWLQSYNRERALPQMAAAAHVDEPETTQLIDAWKGEEPEGWFFNIDLPGHREIFATSSVAALEGLLR